MNHFPMIDMHTIARQAMTLYGFEPYFPSGVMEEVQSLKAFDGFRAFSSEVLIATVMPRTMGRRFIPALKLFQRSLAHRERRRGH